VCDELLRRCSQVEWLREKAQAVPIRLVFESALELMGTTQIGTFKMDPSGKSKGPPPAVKKVLGLFGSQREEDKLVRARTSARGPPRTAIHLPWTRGPLACRAPRRFKSAGVCLLWLLLARSWKWRRQPNLLARLVSVDGWAVATACVMDSMWAPWLCLRRWGTCRS
jgi:Domain of unknown function (DUF3479)